MFDQAKALWLARDKSRVSPALAAQAWGEASLKVEGGGAALLKAVERYLAKGGEVKRGYVREFHRWLADRRYEGWLADEPPVLPLGIEVPLAVPPEVFAVVAAPFSEATARTWLGLAGWDGERRVITAGPTAARWLKLNVAQQLRDVGVDIEERAA